MTRAAALLLSGLGVAWLLSSACSMYKVQPAPAEIQDLEEAAHGDGVFPDGVETWVGLNSAGTVDFFVYGADQEQSAAIEAALRRMADERSTRPFNLHLRHVVDPNAPEADRRFEFRRVRIRAPVASAPSPPVPEGIRNRP